MLGKGAKSVKSGIDKLLFSVSEKLETDDQTNMLADPVTIGLKTKESAAQKDMVSTKSMDIESKTEIVINAVSVN